MECSIEGCTKPHNSRGLCRNHYMQALRAERNPKPTFTCAFCGKSFVPLRYYKSGRNRFCTRKCKQDAHNALAKERHPERMRWYLIQRTYGIGQNEYEALLLWQGGRCAICFTDEPRGRGTWHIDHQHGNGVIRGLLCHSCNVGIGSLGEDPARLQRAADYLER